jgi:hypothetical protein
MKLVNVEIQLRALPTLTGKFCRHFGHPPNRSRFAQANSRSVLANTCHGHKVGTLKELWPLPYAVFQANYGRILLQEIKMAIVRELERITLDHDSKHTEAKDCTYSIIRENDGRKSLQIDTYGSAYRKIPGKKSQSIRFTPEALDQLRRILAEEL